MSILSFAEVSVRYITIYKAKEQKSDFDLLLLRTALYLVDFISRALHILHIVRKKRLLTMTSELESNVLWSFYSRLVWS